ncbi:hypothetical protein QYM36_007818 [Artemia franciscana]|uniref:Peroxisomal ATPase PEX1 n=1 Tax=Artemia franciscana TaxID=6661 RepID=A0AA88IEY6_ARTSF|nr:hypothetical protein QYM36_007818 [Artemia franciscana]
MTTLQLTEALRGGEALVSGRNSQETCVIKVASLEDASKFVLCSAKPNSRQTVIDAQITLNFTFAKSNGLKNNSLVDVTEVKKVLKVTKVYVEPVSSGDYEVLVSNIEGIQSSLLEQFQLVWKGAVIPIRFQGLRSSIRVLRLDNDGQIYGRLVEMTEVHVLNPKHEQSDEETRSFSEFSFESYGINSSFIKRKFKLQNDMAFVSRNTLANFGLVNNFSELSGLLKYDEKEVLVKLYLDDSVPVCHIFMSDSLFSCLDLKRPSLVMFTWINICQVKEPKRLLVKHKQGISLTLAEKEVRNFANGTDHVFFNEGMQIQLCDTIASLHLDPENLAYCKVRPIILKSIPIVFEEEKEQPQKPVLVKNNVLIEDLHDQQALIDIVLSCLPVDPELHGTPQYLVSGCKFGNILVTGGIGCGKTTFVDQICKKLEGPPFGIKAVYLNCVHWKGKSPVSIFGKLEKIWEDLSKVEPSLLVLDNMDVLFCKTENIVVNNPIEASHTDRIVEKLCSIVENTEKNPRLLIIGIAQSKANLHSKLAVNQGRHFFTYFFELKNPNKMQRLKLLQMICPSFLPGETDENFDELLNRMEGYSAADIKCVAERAFDFSFQRHSSQDLANLKVEYDDVEKSLNGYVPTSLQGISLMKNSTIKWNDIGGLKQVKKTLVETLEWPAKFPKLFAQIPIRLRSGILLYGPSGTGKTMLASAVARECGINFISIKVSFILASFNIFGRRNDFNQK